MPTEPTDDRFITVLLANQSRVYRFLFTFVPRREDVEDLFQQTCLTLWQERAKFDPEKGEFASWACAIAGQAEREALECELLTSAETRRFFLSYLELHAGLAWQFRGLECELPDLREVVRQTLRGRWRTGGKCVCPRASGEAVGDSRADWFRSKKLTALNCSSKDRRSPNLKTFIGIESHQRILDRLVAGDVAAATAELQKHIESHKERS
ncbi:MAG: sigma-70 family RNA polymerase sigma factor [Pirellulaceae bacterium]|nr:sigma-70 family RNA polymerase sigma factor [Pirellulaceae bacterium]